MLSIREQIERNITLYMTLKNIIHTKEKTIDKDGTILVKENYLRASQRFNLKKSTDEFDDDAAEKFMDQVKLDIVKELLLIVEVVLEYNNSSKKEEQDLSDMRIETDHYKIFNYVIRKLVEYEVISPHDDIIYEPVYDHEGSFLTAKLKAEEPVKDEDANLD